MNNKICTVIQFTILVTITILIKPVIMKIGKSMTSRLKITAIGNKLIEINRNIQEFELYKKFLLFFTF